MSQPPTEAEECELRALLSDPLRWGDSGVEDLLPTIRPQLRRRRFRRRAGIGVATAAVASIALVGGVAVVTAVKHQPAATLTEGGHVPLTHEAGLPACSLVLKKGYTVPTGLNADGGFYVPLTDRAGATCAAPSRVAAIVSKAGSPIPKNSPFTEHPVLGSSGLTPNSGPLAAGHVAVVSIAFHGASARGEHWNVTIVDAAGNPITTIPAYSSQMPVFTGLRVE